MEWGNGLRGTRMSHLAGAFINKAIRVTHVWHLDVV